MRFIFPFLFVYMRKLMPSQINRLRNLKIIMRYLRDNQGQLNSPYMLKNILFSDVVPSRVAVYLNTLSGRKKIAKVMVKRNVFYKWPYEATRRTHKPFVK